MRDNLWSVPMWNSDAEEPPHKRRKKISPSPSSPLSSLPDDLVLSFLARNSRMDRAALSLVSRGYRSLVSSPDLYKMRSLMGLTETYMYVCLRYSLDDNPRWYILRRGKPENNRLERIPIPFKESRIPFRNTIIPTPSLPTEASSPSLPTEESSPSLPSEEESSPSLPSEEESSPSLPTEEESSPPSLPPTEGFSPPSLPTEGSSPYLPTEGSSVVALDWGIYVVGGLRKGRRTANVWLLDCRTHMWRRAPSMGVHRAYAAAGVVAGKIYVFGGCRDPDTSNWAECFDPKTQTWETLDPAPDWKMRSRLIHDTVVVRDEKVYLVDSKDRTFYYSPSDCKWGRGNRSPLPRNKRDWCVVDKLIFCLDRSGSLLWCEPDGLELEGEQQPDKGMLMNWREVNGLDSLKKTLSSSRLVHFHRKLNAAGQKRIDLLPGARLSSSDGSNIVLFWDVIEGGRLEIWSAEISLERRKGGQIWGNIESSNATMTVHHFLAHDYQVLHAVSVTL